MATPDELEVTIAKILGVEVEEIRLSASFTEDLGADSLDLVTLVLMLEDKYKIQIPDEDAEKLKTVQDAMDYLKDRGVLK